MFAFVSYRQNVLRIALCVSQYVLYRCFTYRPSPNKHMHLIMMYSLMVKASSYPWFVYADIEHGKSYMII